MRLMAVTCLNLPEVLLKAMNMKSFNAPLIKGMSVASKNNDGFVLLQNKLSSIARSLAKGVSGRDNGKTDVLKRESVDSNGNIRHSVCKQMNGENMHSFQVNIENCRNGEHNAVASSQVLVNGGTHLKNGTLDPAKRSIHEINGLKKKETTGRMLENGAICNSHHNECIDISGPRRNLK